MMCFLQGLLKVRPSVFTCMCHKVNDCTVVALDENAIGAEDRIMFSSEENCGCGSRGFCVSGVRTRVKWQTE